MRKPNQYYVLHADQEARTVIAEQLGVPVADVPWEDALTIREFDDRAAAHDYAEEHDGKVFERCNMHLALTPGAGTSIWGYSPVYLAKRPEP